jgi:hypothetical protein
MAYNRKIIDSFVTDFDIYLTINVARCWNHIEGGAGATSKGREEGGDDRESGSGAQRGVGSVMQWRGCHHVAEWWISADSDDVAPTLGLEFGGC